MHCARTGVQQSPSAWTVGGLILILQIMPTLSEMYDALSDERKAQWNAKRRELLDEFYCCDILESSPLFVKLVRTPAQAYLRELYTAQQAEAVPVVLEPWKPRKGDMYWYVSLESSANFFAWNDDVIDKGLLALGGVFPTKEAAEAEARYREAEAWIRREQRRRNTSEKYQGNTQFPVGAGWRSWAFYDCTDRGQVRSELRERRTIDGAMTYYDALITEGKGVEA